MKKRLFITPEYTTANEIKKIRKELHLTQKEFAEFINCSKPTVERWERSKEVIIWANSSVSKNVTKISRISARSQNCRKKCGCLEYGICMGRMYVL